ncbi:MAG TPA: hypothetical protein VGI48_12715 [Caldimonas sp.]
MAHLDAGVAHRDRDHIFPRRALCRAPLSPDYGPRDNAFSGKIGWVRVDIDEAAKDDDHLIGAEERFNLVVARQ